MALNGSTIKVTDIAYEDQRQMYTLMTEYYENYQWKNFSKDLQEKDWIVLFKDETNCVKGFSTLMIMDIDIDGEIVKGVFSGDTVMHKDHWGNLDLPFVWGRFVLMKLPQLYPDHKLFWILISKGYKTYRYLPTHFLSFYPRYDMETPVFEKTIMDRFGELKYSGKYDPSTGIIYTDGTSDAVKEGVAVMKEKHLQDPNLKFFAEKNSGYQKGDELVCIIQASFDNLKPATQEFLQGLEKVANM